MNFLQILGLVFVGFGGFTLAAYTVTGRFPRRLKLWTRGKHRRPVSSFSSLLGGTS